MLRSWLSHPLLRNVPLDDPRTPRLRREILQQKPFVNQIYREWYQAIHSHLPTGTRPVLEIGTGAGFLDEYLPNLITSDIVPLPWLSLVLDGGHLPFAENSFDALVMCNTLHHLPAVSSFFKEAGRCVRDGGVMIMIETWVTRWSSFIYSKFHHETFDPASAEWDLPRSGPLTTANSALPWILFERDRDAFHNSFPHWKIRKIRACMPLRYILSGGVSLRSLMPSWSFTFWRTVEEFLDRWQNNLAMFALIILDRGG